MTETHIIQILQGMEHDISHIKPERIKPLLCDKWVASSAWQKSIRRRHTEKALQAAVTLWQSDRQNFWHRCFLVALEDCGVGDSDTVTKVLLACSATVWRRKLGDLPVALYLTRLMANATKSRLSDHIFILAEHAPEYAPLRQELGKKTSKELMRDVLTKKTPLPHRVMALWLLAGTQRYMSHSLPRRVGRLEEAIDTLNCLKVSPLLLSACIQNLKRSEYPLCLFMPLLADAAQGRRSVKIQDNVMPAMLETEGIPHYAADQFTRLGKTAIREFQASLPELKRFSTKQLGLGVFYLDGALVQREVCSSQLNRLKQAGEFADIEATGLCIPEYLG